MDPQQVADAVLAHPAVARLDGGPFGAVASYLPGRRVVGVRLGEAPEPVEVAVVVRWPWPAALPAVAGEIAAVVRRVVGDRQVDVRVSDVEVDGRVDGQVDGPVGGRADAQVGPTGPAPTTPGPLA